MNPLSALFSHRYFVANNDILIIPLEPTSCQPKHLVYKHDAPLSEKHCSIIEGPLIAVPMVFCVIPAFLGRAESARTVLSKQSAWNHPQRAKASLRAKRPPYLKALTVCQKLPSSLTRWANSVCHRSEFCPSWLILEQISIWQVKCRVNIEPSLREGLLFREKQVGI